ncbi:antibiotic biosynthesis monooxygenase [Fibrella sp. WM1]|uniref:antibiotic biosynthesis monooxygenase family protein n=1 Tax=Fibrella musci TaxID=3242485 RepID=UPI0035226DDF
MNTPLNVIVRFDVPADGIDALIALIGHFFRNEVSRFPGFISAKLHRNEEGTVLINYATWESQEAFFHFMTFARDSEFSKQIQAYKPTQDRVFEVSL